MGTVARQFSRDATTVRAAETKERVAVVVGMVEGCVAIATRAVETKGRVVVVMGTAGQFLGRGRRPALAEGAVVLPVRAARCALAVLL